MAVGMLLAGEGFTSDAYRGLTEKMFGAYPMNEGDSPEGMILHTAGPSGQGWYVYDVWESKEHFQRFVDSKLMPAMQELGVEGPGPQPQFFEIEVMVKGPAL